MADQKLTQLGSLPVGSEKLVDLLYTVSAGNQYNESKNQLYQHFLNNILITGFQVTGSVNISGLIAGDWISHVVNSDHVTGRASSILAGYNNSIRATFCSVVCGNTNEARGNNSAILAGNSSVTWSSNSAVGCGEVNIASGDSSFVAGGTFNKTDGAVGYNFIGAGAFNRVTGSSYAGVLAGYSCTAGFSRSVVGAGFKNHAQFDDAGVFCGSYNSGAGGSSFIGAGGANRIYVGTAFSSITAGSGNQVNASFSNIQGGALNVINAGADYSSAAGFSNIVNDDFGTVNGSTNIINVGAQYGTIAGGYGHSIIDGNYGSILGGTLNATQGLYATIIAGAQNYAMGEGSIAAGNSSVASGYYSISLGVSNLSSGRFAISIGDSNKSSGNYSISMGRRGIIHALHSGAVLFGDGVNKNHHSMSFDSCTLDFTSGLYLKNGTLKLHLGQRVPTLGSDPGTQGEITADANNLYICTAANSWKYIALTSL